MEIAMGEAKIVDDGEESPFYRILEAYNGLAFNFVRLRLIDRDRTIMELLVKRYMKQAHIEATGSCHLLAGLPVHPRVAKKLIQPSNGSISTARPEESLPRTLN